MSGMVWIGLFIRLGQAIDFVAVNDVPARRRQLDSARSASIFPTRTLRYWSLFSLPSESNSFPAAATHSIGPCNTRACNGTRQLITMNCPVSPPVRPALADINTVGLPLNGIPSTRLIQSNAFFRTPLIPLLYSGDEMTIASAFLTCFARA